MGRIANGVGTGVGTDLLKESGVGIAKRAEVELLCPATGIIKGGKIKHHVGAKLLLRGGVGERAGANFAEDGAGLRVGAISRVATLEPVVAEAGAEGMEGIVAFFERVEKSIEGAGVVVGGAGEFIRPRVECAWGG